MYTKSLKGKNGVTGSEENQNRHTNAKEFNQDFNSSMSAISNKVLNAVSVLSKPKKGASVTQVAQHLKLDPKQVRESLIWLENDAHVFATFDDHFAIAFE